MKKFLLLACIQFQLIYSQSIENKIAEGLSYLYLEDFESAIEIFSNLYEKDPANTEILYNLSLAYFKNNQNDRALSYISKAFDIDGTNPRIANLYGTLLALVKNYSAAEKKFESIYSKDSTSVYIKINLANVKKSLGKFIEAEKFYLAALKEDENSFQANYNYGLFLYERGNYLAAETYLLKSTQLKEDLKALYYAAKVFYQDGKYAEAAELYSRYLELKEEKIKLKQSNKYAAKDDRNELKPFEEKLLTSIGQKISAAEEYFFSNDISKSLRMYMLALQEDYKNHLLHYNIGVCFYILGKYQEAARYFYNSYKLKPEEANALYNLGVSYYRQKFYEEAKKYLKLSYEIDSLDNDIIYNFALAIFKLEKNSFEIIRLLNKLPQDSPYSLKSKIIIACVYANNGDYISSKNVLESVLQIAPYNLEANYNLAVVYKKLNDEANYKLKIKLSAEIGKNEIEKK